MATRKHDLFADLPPAWPGGLVYHEDFIAPAEEARLLGSIAELPLTEAQYKAYTARRRTVSFGSSYDFDANRLNAEAPIPPFLHPLRDRAADWLGVAPDRIAHALVTEYRPGTPLGWHRDVPQFAEILGISLGTACRMRFRPYPPRPNPRDGVFAVTLAPRSAYIMRGDARWRWQHSVPPTPGLRFSITFRTAVTSPAAGA